MLTESDIKQLVEMYPGRYGMNLRDKLITLGIAATDTLNQCKFDLGRLAVQARQLPKPHKMPVRTFAKEIGFDNPSRLQDYATVAAYYGNGERIQQARGWANLSWSHWREAMKMKQKDCTHSENVTASLEMLKAASDNGWSVMELNAQIAAWSANKPVEITAICFDSQELDNPSIQALLGQIRHVLYGIEARETVPIVRIYERSWKESENVVP